MLESLPHLPMQTSHRAAQLAPVTTTTEQLNRSIIELYDYPYFIGKPVLLYNAHAKNFMCVKRFKFFVNSESTAAQQH